MHIKINYNIFKIFNNLNIINNFEFTVYKIKYITYRAGSNFIRIHKN